MASRDHIEELQGHSDPRHVAVSPSTIESLSPPSAVNRPLLPSSPSALSISRPQPTVPLARLPALATAASTRNPSPSPQGQTTPHPVLLNSLTATDGQSILCIAVEEDEPEDRERGRNRSQEREKGGVKTRGRVYGGSQGGDIHVWDLGTLSLKARLTGHEGAVLSLQLVRERDWLISSSGDGTIRVWHTPSLSLFYLIHPPHDNIGDIFSLTWVPHELIPECQHPQHAAERQNSISRKNRGRLYAGCQDTSIQWIDLPPEVHSEAFSSHPSGSPLPQHVASLSYFARSSSPPIHRPPNKFFDSLSNADKVRARMSGEMSASRSVDGGTPKIATPSPGQAEYMTELQFEEECIQPFAHYGYIYCLLLTKSNERTVLVSGSGDEQVKLWEINQHSLRELAILESSSDAVLALAGRDNTLFAGHQGGVIKIWDLDTLTCIRTLRPHSLDILNLTTIGDHLYSGASNGTIQRWDRSFKLVHEWQAHDKIVLSSEASFMLGKHLLTGGSDAALKVWDIRDEDHSIEREPLQHGFQGSPTLLPPRETKRTLTHDGRRSLCTGKMFHLLAKLVSFKTIADDVHREDCRQGSLYFKRVLRSLGAETALLPGAPGKNPIILATFRANAPLKPNRFEAPRRKRVLCYGHYDVVDASSTEQWSYPPFEMSGKDGWIYGRGVTDNKGPMLAVAAAASELRAKQELEVDLVMVIEGEEETGSAGFQDAIRKNRDLIGEIDVIFVSNSYWIGETIPCLTFGLRGVIHATIKVESDQPDLHSGIHGGVISEPLNDLVRLLATLTDADGRVRIPGFLDDVRPLDPAERILYEAVIERCTDIHSKERLSSHSHISDPLTSLVTRWRQPAFSVHKVSVPAAEKTLIPGSATASVSIRIVPDQSLLDIVEKLKTHLQRSFALLRTRNNLSVDISHVSDWWLGDLQSPYLSTLAECIKNEWGIEPLYIREGGSIPSLPFLEREFAADSVHLPLGTSSDSAHLPDERIRIVNLERGQTVISNWLTAIARLPVPV
ncbi:hypothetical protein JCM3766R1_005079 [Sporobolomyces carnicolor]